MQILTEILSGVMRRTSVGPVIMKATFGACVDQLEPRTGNWSRGLRSGAKDYRTGCGMWNFSLSELRPNTKLQGGKSSVPFGKTGFSKMKL
jgi:hypothetical protein